MNQQLIKYAALRNTNVEIHCFPNEQPLAQDILDSLTQKIPGVLSVFTITEPFPSVRVVLVPNRDEFDRLVRDLLQVAIEIPSHPARIAQAQKTDIVLLSPAVYETQSRFKYIPEEFRRLVVHEFIHIVEEFLSPDIEVSPRWWGEGLAVYFSDQWHFEKEFNQAARDSITNGKIPSLNQITNDPTLAYDWGWTIVKFIADNDSVEKIVQIVKQCSDGNVLAFLPTDQTQLEKDFRNWILKFCDL